jgi:hypothetical protein
LAGTNVAAKPVYRFSGVVLTIVSVAISVFVLLGLNAVLGLLLCIAVANDVLVESLGLMLCAHIFSFSNVFSLALIYLSTLVVTVLPALQAYRVSKSVGGGSPDS